MASTCSHHIPQKFAKVSAPAVELLDAAFSETPSPTSWVRFGKDVRDFSLSLARELKMANGARTGAGVLSPLAASARGAAAMEQAYGP